MISSAIPFLGYGATAVKAARWGDRIVDAVDTANDARRTADNVADAGRTMDGPPPHPGRHPAGHTCTRSVQRQRLPRGESWQRAARYCRSRERVRVRRSVARDGDAWRATVDISTGEGVVLADGPTRTLAMDSSGAMRSEMLLYLADVQRFIADHERLMREALC